MLLLVFVPFAAHADDNSPASANYSLPQSTMPSSTATDTPAGLGPASTSTPAGGSSADASALQPAGGSPLQSTTSDSSGLTTPNQNALQAPATSDDTLKVLLGDADGPTRQFAGDTPDNNWNWLWITLVFGVVTTAIYLALRRYPRLLPVDRFANFVNRKLHR